MERRVQPPITADPSARISTRAMNSHRALFAACSRGRVPRAVGRTRHTVVVPHAQTGVRPPPRRRDAETLAGAGNALKLTTWFTRLQCEQVGSQDSISNRAPYTRAPSKKRHAVPRWRACAEPAKRARRRLPSGCHQETV